MEPRIRYARTEDGVSIAYWTLGEGTPLVWMPFPTSSHTQLEWRIAANRDMYGRIAEHRKLVRYDGRGLGLSDRNVADYSLDALVSDLEAVVDHLDLAKFALVASSRGCPAGIVYATRNPERVSHLVLWSAMARMDDESWPPRIRAAQSLAGQDWELFTETFAHSITGWSRGDRGLEAAAFMREAVTQQDYQALDAVLQKVDVTDLLRKVQSPTLVLQRRELVVPPVGTARGLASRIPNAALTLIDGDSMSPIAENAEAVLAAIDEFLSEDEEVTTASETLEPGAFRTVLFTDVEGSTALTDRLGDTRARELLREHEGVVRESLKAHGGSEVKTMGDGFMTSFSSATKALECAIAMQQSFAQRNASANEAINVRMGLNAGEPIAEDDPGGRGDLFGTAVNLAARIAAKAEGGEILASNVVRELVAGKDFLFNDRGDTELRGFEDPVRVYEVRWQEQD